MLSVDWIALGTRSWTTPHLYVDGMTEANLVHGDSSDPVATATTEEFRHLGAYTATITYRPLDGGEPLRIEKFADTEDEAISDVVEAALENLGQVQTMAPDSPAVRTFINAASHMRDLRQALETLEAASVNASVANHLQVYAVVAYGRTFGSNARPDLSTFVSLSPQDVSLTAQLKTIRNKYAAHSENSMCTTTPVLELHKQVDGTIEIVEVFGITVDSSIPQSFIIEFAEMLPRLIEQLTSALQPLKDAIRDELTQQTRSVAFDNPQPMQFVITPLAEWEPALRRPGYPASRLAPVYMEIDQMSLEATIAR